MTLTATVPLFIERPLFIDMQVSCIMITYPISSNSCKKISLQCCRLYNFPSFRSSHWRCSVRKGVLRNFAKFTWKHPWQSPFFNSCRLSPLLLIFLLSSLEDCLFHFNRKMKWKKGNTLIECKHLFFCSSIDFFDAKGNLTDGNLIRKCFYREFDVAVFMVRGISLGESFWVANTWPVPVWKWFKGSTLNFAQTFLIDCCTKPCPLFTL